MDELDVVQEFLWDNNVQAIRETDSLWTMYASVLSFEPTTVFVHTVLYMDVRTNMDVRSIAGKTFDLHDPSSLQDILEYLTTISCLLPVNPIRRLTVLLNDKPSFDMLNSRY